MKLDTVNPDFLAVPENYWGMFFNYELLKGFTEQPEYKLPERFLDEAIAKGDQCYGFTTNDGVLAAYQWYSTKPTWVFTPTKRGRWNGLLANFGEQYVYMYKGFTHPIHRGKGLYPVGVTSALASYLTRGYKGILSIVESNNFASLKSCYRMGYRDFSKIYVAALFDRYLVYSDPDCGAYDFRLTTMKWPVFPSPMGRATAGSSSGPDERESDKSANSESRVMSLSASGRAALSWSNTPWQF